MRDIFAISGAGVTPNRFFIITKNFYSALMDNFCLKNFSIEAIDGEVVELQRQGVGPQKTKGK